MTTRLRSVAVTGADGFIGAHLCDLLDRSGSGAVRIVRRLKGDSGDRRVVQDLATSGDLDAALRGVDAVVHLAARAHVLRETAVDPVAAFDQVNLVGTIRLAEAALRCGAKRFVFVSSIGVNGNMTHGVPFTEDDAPAPVEPYAASKLRAERALGEMCANRLELVIVRPTLVYGPGAIGNFGRLVNLAAAPFPLPLGRVRNRRSLIGVGNLCALLMLCTEHPQAAGQLFLAAEPETRSTPELLERISTALGRPCKMFGVPAWVLERGAALVGKRKELDKLCGSLEVSSEKSQRLLGWRPLIAFAEEMERVAAERRASRARRN